MANVHGEIVLLDMISMSLAELRVTEIELMALLTAVHVFFSEQLQRDIAAKQLSMDVVEVWHDRHRLKKAGSLQRIGGLYVVGILSIHIKVIVDTLRGTTSEQVAKVLDYAKGISGMPTTNLLKYCFKDGLWIAIRPSGTEPRLKLYCSLVEKDECEAKVKFSTIQRDFEQKFILRII